MAESGAGRTYHFYPGWMLSALLFFSQSALRDPFAGVKYEQPECARLYLYKNGMSGTLVSVNTFH